MEIKEVEVSKLQLNPEDVVVIKLNDNIPDLASDQYDKFYHALSILFPDNKSLILHNADIVVVSKNVLPTL